MKLVVYGPDRRLGVVHDDRVIDVSGAFAKYAHEVMGDGLPYEVAAATVPDELGKFIEAGERAVESATAAVEYLTRRAGDHHGVRGEPLVELLSGARLHAPYARRARIMMAGGNYVIHSAGMSYRGGEAPAPSMQEIYDQSRARGIWGFYCFPENAAGPGDDMSRTYPRFDVT